MHEPTPLALSKDLVAASAVPLILAILEKGDSYGYAILQEVRERSGGEIEWADGMLYPILHRLEKRKLVEAYWGTADNGRQRKYYRLRRTGRAELAAQRAHWARLNALLQRA
jgi:PadR family transcriptional regulator PadR